MMFIHEFHLLELWIEMNVHDPHSFLALLKLQRKRPGGDSNPDLCDADAVLHQLRYQTNWELVLMCVDHKPVDDGYSSI